MPRVIVHLNPNNAGAGLREAVSETRDFILEKVVEIASTEKNPVTIRDMEFYMNDRSMSIIAAPVSIDIVITGHKDCKKKFTVEVVTKLKEEIVTRIRERGLRLKEEDVSIWVKFIDPDGIRV